MNSPALKLIDELIDELTDECIICGIKENIHKHHISYFPEVVKPLCRSCHYKLHALARAKYNKGGEYEDNIGNYGLLDVILKIFVSLRQQYNIKDPFIFYSKTSRFYSLNDKERESLNSFIIRKVKN